MEDGSITPDTVGIERTALTQIDSIEIQNGSQIDTRKAAIRFENAIANKHFVSNSAFHNGMGWGFMAKRSKNIVLDNNVYFNFRPIGIGMDDV